MVVKPSLFVLLLELVAARFVQGQSAAELPTGHAQKSRSPGESRHLVDLLEQCYMHLSIRVLY